MNSSAIRRTVGNSRQQSSYVDGKDTNEQILKKYSPDLIKSDLISLI